LLLSIIIDKKDLEEKIKQLKMITTRFDCRYMSEKTLSLLEENGFAFLASELLLESQYSFPWYLRFRLALSSLNFSYALTIIRNQFQEDYDGIVPESSEYFTYFVELAKTSLDYGQFDVASTCFDMMEDMWSLFKIFSFDANLNALSFLAKKCKNDPELYSIFEACNVILQSELLEEESTVQNWSMKVNGGTEDFELGREIIGRMKCRDKAIDLLDLDDLSTWMGATEIKDQDPLTVEEKTFDYNKEFGGERRKSVTLLSLEGIEDATLPTPRNRSEKTNSEPKSEQEMENEVDTSSARESAQEAARKEFMDSSEDEDDDDEDSARNKKRRKLFRSIRISTVAIKDEKATSSLKIGGLEENDGEEEEEKKPKKFGANLEDDDEDEEPKPKPKVKPKFGGLKQLQLENDEESDEGSEKKIHVQQPKFALPQVTPLPESGEKSMDKKPTINLPPLPTNEIKRPEVPQINLASQQQIVNPGECLKKGMEFMEKGQYVDGIKQVNAAIQALIVDNSQILKKNNIVLCVRYKFLIFALAKLQKLELSKGDPSDAALISTCMTQIVIPNQKHNIITKNMAIKRNMAVKNYGISSSIIKDLRKIAPQNLKDILLTSYKECENQQFSDAHPFKEGSKFCWKNFTIIDPLSQGLQCSYCEATYQSSDVSKVDQTCYYCSYGKLQKIQ
jgi:hypothetical protein